MPRKSNTRSFTLLSHKVQAALAPIRNMIKMWLTTSTFKPMRTTLVAALLCAAGVVVPCIRAQHREPSREEFLAQKAKAATGDAEAQFIVGDSYDHGHGVEKDFVE